MDPDWANAVGLSLDIIVAVFLMYGIIVSKKKAAEVGGSYWAGETDEENLKLPPVRDCLLQSRNAIIGGLFLIASFVLQIYGSWPR
ncbi:hypothetical protein [Pelomicrobium methylotrophicum]|uniref:Uncharacterized protein n=1 Tax=Pelomicrobium methylotrophicum TaxID=2602750 RepID=A0A5C7EMP2_9PROT|nr:hypothetical protein [Pelomicrobium methylotrophicum]TXF13763.1 hypothetical protein FR698_01250 [Pelomicrobium methylotrophicum]